MTQPTDQPTTAQQERIKRGGRASVETRKKIPGRITQANADRVVVEFADTSDLDKQISDLGAEIQAHLVFTVAGQAALGDLTMQVYVDTPNANAKTPADSPGYATTVAFFEHEGGAHAAPEFRIPLTLVLKRLGPRRSALTSTFVPVAFPGRNRDDKPVTVKADLYLVKATVER